MHPTFSSFHWQRLPWGLKISRIYSFVLLLLWTDLIKFWKKLTKHYLGGKGMVGRRRLREINFITWQKNTVFCEVLPPLSEYISEVTWNKIVNKNLSKTLVTPSLSCAHIHLLSSDWERRSCLSKYFYCVSMCVLVCLSTVISSVFGKSFHFPFLYFKIFRNIYFFLK